MQEVLTMLTEMQTTYEAVTDTDIQRAQRQLRPMGKDEKALGVVHNLAARRLWCTAKKFEAAAAKAEMQAKFEAEAAEDEQRSLCQVARCKGYDELVRDAFWTQVKEDIGAPAWLAEEGIAIRADWMIVACTADGNPLAEVLRRMTSGHVGE